MITEGSDTAETIRAILEGGVEYVSDAAKAKVLSAFDALATSAAVRQQDAARGGTQHGLALGRLLEHVAERLTPDIANDLREHMAAQGRRIAALEEDAKSWAAREQELKDEVDHLRGVAQGYSDERDEARAKLAKARDAVCDLHEEIAAWKEASGLECGGDPGGVTPDMLRKDVGERDVALRAAESALATLRQAVSPFLTDVRQSVAAASGAPDEQQLTQGWLPTVGEARTLLAVHDAAPAGGESVPVTKARED